MEKEEPLKRYLAANCRWRGRSVKIQTSVGKAYYTIAFKVNTRKIALCEVTLLLWHKLTVI